MSHSLPEPHLEPGIQTRELRGSIPHSKYKFCPWYLYAHGHVIIETASIPTSEVLIVFNNPSTGQTPNCPLKTGESLN